MQVSIYSTESCVYVIFHLVVGKCKSRGATRPIKKSIGETVHFLCPHFQCEGATYNFNHYNHTTGEAELIHQGSHIYTWEITSLSNTGDYCCNQQCDDDQRQCCITVEGRNYL